MFYQMNTENRSVLEVVNSLKEKGIQNNKFLLTLFDESLIDSNIRGSDDLEVQKRSKIKEEIKQNIWYFIREVIGVVYKNGAVNHIILTEAMTAAIYSVLRGNPIIYSASTAYAGIDIIPFYYSKVHDKNIACITNAEIFKYSLPYYLLENSKNCTLYSLSKNNSINIQNIGDIDSYDCIYIDDRASIPNIRELYDMCSKSANKPIIIVVSNNNFLDAQEFDNSFYDMESMPSGPICINGGKLNTILRPLEDEYWG